MATYCISCNTTPAYISYFGKCECSNPDCKFYSRDLYPPADLSPVANPDTKITAPDQNSLEDEDIETSSVYRWITHHNDFGDI